VWAQNPGVPHKIMPFGMRKGTEDSLNYPTQSSGNFLPHGHPCPPEPTAHLSFDTEAPGVVHDALAHPGNGLCGTVRCVAEDGQSWRVEGSLPDPVDSCVEGGVLRHRLYQQRLPGTLENPPRCWLAQISPRKTCYPNPSYPPAPPQPLLLLASVGWGMEISSNF
jgi:hypothetical protein